MKTRPALLTGILLIFCAAAAFVAAPHIKSLISPEAPACGDSKVTLDVKTIMVKSAGREMMHIIGIEPGEQQTAMLDEQTARNEQFINRSITVDSITMGGYDAESKKRSCQAELRASDSPIASTDYTTQITEDEKQYIVSARFSKAAGKPPQSFVDTMRTIFPDVAIKIDEIAAAAKAEQERKDRIAMLSEQRDELIESTERTWRTLPFIFRSALLDTEREIYTKFSDRCPEKDQEEKLNCQISASQKIMDAITSFRNGSSKSTAPPQQSPEPAQSTSSDVSN